MPFWGECSSVVTERRRWSFALLGRVSPVVTKRRRWSFALLLLSCGTVHLASHTFARSFGLLVRFTLSSLPQLSARLIAHLIARLMCTPGPALGPQHGPVLPRHSCDVMVGCNKSRFKPPLQAIHKGALLFQIPRQGWRTRGAGCLRVRAGERERVLFCTHECTHTHVSKR